VVTLAFTLSGCEQPAEPATESSATEVRATISNTELQARIDNGTAPLILDVRSADEYKDGHIKGAVNISHTDIGSYADLLPPQDNEIVVHCYSGKRAAIAEATLADLGYTNVRHLEGDYIGWKEAGLPLE